LLGSKSDVLLLDVTPLSLGIETLGGRMTKLIERNTTIPKRAVQVFSTAEDNQPAVTIRVFQGEREMTAGNRLLGQVNLEDIPPAPGGGPQTEGTFDTDANGMLEVAAKDLGTGKEKKIRIESSSGLSADEVERMRRDAESHAEEDKRWRELVDTRNHADQLVYQTEKLLRDNAANLSEQDKAPLTSAIERVKQAASGEDVNAIKQALSDLEQAVHAMSQHLYQRQQTGGAQGGTGGTSDGSKGGGGKDEGVIDAEFEVKK